MNRKVLIFMLCCLTQMLWGQTDSVGVDSLPWPQNLQAKIDTIVSGPLMETTQLGLMVYDLTADSVIYRYGHRQRLRPASTMKVLTAITALDRLGGDYQLKTSLFYTGTIRNNTLWGNLHCIGGMDPLFGRPDMMAFVNKVRHLGIDTIRGSIVVDLSFKDDNSFGEGWCWDDENDVLTPLLYDGKDCFAEQFARMLRRDGVVFVDVDTHAPLSSRRHITSRSHGIGEVLIPMMKESNNLYAESVFYQLSAADNNRTATAKLSASRVKRLIQDLGLNPGDYRIADGSGLSLYNYVSAELETNMLRYAYVNGHIFSQLYSTLPIAGIDGTLKTRMKRTAAEGNVHAKTGSVSGISSLAGYCKASNGHWLCFSIIIQGVSRMSDGRHMQDRICQAMCE